jgi:hypothetical protein
MGPSMPDDKEIDRVTDEVLQFLREMHRIQTMPIPFPTGINTKNREADRAKLREAVKILLESRNCEEF